MKVMESSAVFQPKQRAEKGSREDGNQSKAGPNPNLGPNRASKSTIVRGAHKAIDAARPSSPTAPGIGGNAAAFTAGQESRRRQ
jgi:hypothetical protein